MGRIKFGTDGWRAVIAEDFTFKNVERLAQATADYWNVNPIAGTPGQKPSSGLIGGFFPTSSPAALRRFSLETVCMSR